MSLLARLRAHAWARSSQPAVVGAGGTLTYADLASEVDALVARLVSGGYRTLALAMDNGLAWAVADLAALDAGVALVPLPPFFSDRQLRHCLEQASVEAVLTDTPEALAARVPAVLKATTSGTVTVAGTRLALLAAAGHGGAVPGSVVKITYTSGTTGEPRGVMLRRSDLEPVVASLATAAEVTPTDRCLATMPLAVLLENIGSLYVAVWAGATAVLPPLRETGLRGAANLDAEQLRATLARHRASTVIFTPQTLQGLVERLEAGAAAPATLRFAAVGGAPVAPALLARAAAAGLPVFEGYGLSECASVVCLNTPSANRPGSVGHPLPHVRLRVSADGEVRVAGQGFAGYLGEPPRPSAEREWRTGDLGYLDADGFLHLTGRRRNVFITAYGRNVAPEWVERELTLEPAIAQAVVFGEARPWNTAVLVPAPGADTAEVAAAVARANGTLPDYARVSRWVLADGPFTPETGLLTSTGRVRRQAVLERYGERIESFYRQEIAS